MFGVFLQSLEESTLLFFKKYTKYSFEKHLKKKKIYFIVVLCITPYECMIQKVQKGTNDFSTVIDSYTRGPSASYNHVAFSR